MKQKVKGGMRDWLILTRLSLDEILDEGARLTTVNLGVLYPPLSCTHPLKFAYI
jgi:hypothetical protein